MRALLWFFLLLLGLLLVGSAGAAASTDWFDNEGEGTLQSYAPSVFPDLSEEQLSSLSIGDPVPGMTLSEGMVDPRISGENPDVHAAPVLLEEDIVGVITNGEDADGEQVSNVYSDPHFGEELQNMEEGDILIVDTAIHAHFIIRDNYVIPISAGALDQLAGSTSVESFLELRQSLQSDSNSIDVVAEPSDRSPVVFALVLVVLFLSGTLLATWLRRSPHAPQPPAPIERRIRQVRMYRRGGNRVNADD